MHNISQTQLINLWMELEDCLHGCNGYGGTDAEIYVHTMMPHTPICEHYNESIRTGACLGEYAEETWANAAKSMYEVFRLFEQKRNCTISIGYCDNKPDLSKDEFRKLGIWFLEVLWTHRIHVKVKKNED